MNTNPDTTSSDFIFNGEANESWSFSDHKEIASRGFNLLFSANHKGCRYLLKGLKPEYRQSEIYQLQMLKEYRLGKSLKHEHICQTYSIADDAVAGRCIVMEYVEGCNLKQWLGQKPSTALRHKVFGEILSALEYCHAKQVTICDIKPSNIMIARQDNIVKLIDFGLADNDNYLMLKQTGGTHGYMAPEQLQSGSVMDARTDIYALGCLMRDLFPHRYRVLSWHCRRATPSHRPRRIQVIRHWYYFWRWLPWMVLTIIALSTGIWLMPKPQPIETVVTTEVVLHDTVAVEPIPPSDAANAEPAPPSYDNIEQSLYASLDEVYHTEIARCMDNDAYTLDIESELRRRRTIVVNNLLKTSPAQYHNMIQKDAAAITAKLNETYREQIYECRLLSVKRN